MLPRNFRASHLDTEKSLKIATIKEPNSVKSEPLASPLYSDIKPILPDVVKSQGLAVSGKIIVAFTNLPSQIHYKRQQDAKTTFSLSPVRGNSSVYSSFYYLDEQTPWETHLVGWTGELVSEDKHPDDLHLTEEEKEEATKLIQEDKKTKNIHPVWLLRQDQQRWRKYPENVLSPVFHYINQNTISSAIDEEWWTDYVRFNEAVATKILEIYTPGDIVWVHDYYLLLLPNILRMKLPDVNVGLYLHTPFPSSEYFRCLSRRQAILEGMLGADRIGFQATSFMKHFVSSATRILGCEATPNSVTAYGRTTTLETVASGIDAELIIHDAFQPKVDERVKTIREGYQDCKIIVGRDRMDSVRGVLQKLDAFDQFLSMYPEWQENVVLIQVSSPILTVSNSAYEKSVTEMVNYINSKYGTIQYNPVHHFQMRIDKEEYLALLRVADLCLITSVRDGMNTTALEFVASQMGHYSPLILSEFSGTTTILPDAKMVNPWDAVGVARTINECLLMSDSEKILLHEKLFQQVSTHTVQYATNTFLSHFVEGLGSAHIIHSTPPLDRPEVLRKYNSAKKRLFMFDYDGTLTPIVKDPDAAIPTSRTIHLLRKLAEDPKNRIWIISGRDQKFLDKWLGSTVPQLGLSAEHGCFVKDINSLKWFNLTENLDMKWQQDVENVFTYYTERTPGSFIERKKVALTWHYRKADREFGEFQARELKQHLNGTVAVKYDVEVMSGKANIEVRPKFVNKGEIVKRLTLSVHGDKQNFDTVTSTKPVKTEELLGKHLPDFIFCIGDDKTDEDMFEALISIEDQWAEKDHDFGMFPVTVGPASKKTIAKAHLLEPSQVLDTIGLLVGEVSIFREVGSVKIDDRGHQVKEEE